MAYVRITDFDPSLKGLACGADCTCQPCRSRHASLGERYVSDEDDQGPTSTGRIGLLPAAAGGVAAALGPVVFDKTIGALTGGSLDVASDVVQAIHSDPRSPNRYQKKEAEFLVDAHHPRYGFGRQEFWFRLSFEFNGHDIRNAKIEPLVDRSSRMIASSFRIEFRGDSLREDAQRRAAVVFNIRGVWNPVGRGVVAFDGKLLLRADGEYKLTEFRSERDWVRLVRFVNDRITPVDLFASRQSLKDSQGPRLGEWNPTRHGQYCGWGTACGKPDCGPPADDMDTCCRTHDRCYTDAGINFVTSKFPSNREKKLTCDRPFCECLKRAKVEGLRARGYRWGAMKIFCP